MRTSIASPRGDRSETELYSTGGSTGYPTLGSPVSQSATAFLLGSGMVLAAMVTGTTSSTPVDASPVLYIGSWTSTARTVDVTDGSATAEAVANGPDRQVQLADDAAVRWLHQESGLTWDQLGRLFGVSRRAVHLWANGGRLNAANAETLSALVAAVRELPAVTPDERRSMLLAPDQGERSIVDRFRARHGTSPRDVSGTPFTPDQLLGALHGDVAD